MPAKQYSKSVLALEVVKEIMDSDQHRIQDCVSTMYLSCGAEFSEDFAAKATSLFRDDRMVGMPAVNLIAVCYAFMHPRPGLYYNLDARAGGFGLVHSSMIACRRQVCSSLDPYHAQVFVTSIMQILL